MFELLKDTEILLKVVIHWVVDAANCDLSQGNVSYLIFLFLSINYFIIYQIKLILDRDIATDGKMLQVR